MRGSGESEIELFVRSFDLPRSNSGPDGPNTVSHGITPR